MCYYLPMKSYSSKEIIKILQEHGWYEVNCEGSHHQFKHSTIKGRVTVPHPKKDLPTQTVKDIGKQSGINFN